MHLIPFRTAAYTLLALFTAAILFQFTVLAGWIPVEMVWGGRLQNNEERTVGAWVSTAVLMLCAFLVLIRMGRLLPSLQAVSKWGMWAVCALFALNTIGNLFALDLRETLIFTPITLVTSLLAARLALRE